MDTNWLDHYKFAPLLRLIAWFLPSHAALCNFERVWSGFGWLFQMDLQE
jgi:hypothetical protein